MKYKNCFGVFRIQITWCVIYMYSNIEFLHRRDSLIFLRFIQIFFRENADIPLLFMALQLLLENLESGLNIIVLKLDI